MVCLSSDKDKYINPKIADNVEPIIMASRATFALSGFLKDNAVKNKDIVKPIPANKLMPKICFMLVFSCKTQSFVLMLMKTKVLIPKAFPMNNAKMIPIPRPENKSGKLWADKTMVVFAKANIGKMK